MVRMLVFFCRAQPLRPRSYECDEYVMNDTPNDDIRALRNALNVLEGKEVEPTRTRSGRVLYDSSEIAGASLTQLEPTLAQQGQEARHLDQMQTVVARWRHTLLSRAFNSWREYTTLASSYDPTGVDTEGKVTCRETSPADTKFNGPSTTSQPDNMGAFPSPAHTGLAKHPMGVDQPALVNFRVPKGGHKGLIPGMVGLRNLGQTCYMNAVLQSVGHTVLYRRCLNELGKQQSLVPTRAEAAPMFTPGFLSRQSTEACHDKLESSFSRFGGGSSSGRRRQTANSAASAPADEVAAALGTEDSATICQDLDSLFRVMWSGKWSVVTPHAVLEAVWKLVPSFRGYKQQDAQELLCELQDRIIQVNHAFLSRGTYYKLLLFQHLCCL